MLAQVSGPDVSQLIFDLDIVGVDSAFPHQLLDKKIPQCHVLDSGVVGPISGDVHS